MLETITLAIENALKNTVLRFLKWILVGTINSSYIICLVACMLALIFYISGCRKAGKYCSISFIIYFILQAIKGLVI